MQEANRVEITEVCAQLGLRLDVIRVSLFSTHPAQVYRMDSEVTRADPRLLSGQRLASPVQRDRH